MIACATCFRTLLLIVVLGESDLVYTQTVCAMETENFEGKEVLILGGGDGGILHELRKLKPKHIIMAEVRISHIFLPSFSLLSSHPPLLFNRLILLVSCIYNFFCFVLDRRGGHQSLQATHAISLWQ